MVELKIKHSYVEVNKCFVHLQQYGCRRNLLKISQTISDHRNKSKRGDETEHLVIFLPGNPGAIGVYHDFLSMLFKQMNGTTILAIGHNDFDHPDHVNHQTDERISIDDSDLNFVERTLSNKWLHDPHHIELQVLNKVIIIRRLLTSPFKVVFVGHSIGCYIILRLLQEKHLASAHMGSILIHPALENMAITEKGRFYDRFFNLKIDLAMRLAAFLLDTLLPNFVKLILTRRVCSAEFVANSSDEVVESVMQLTCYKHLNAIVSMAKSELACVKRLDSDQMIKPHVPKLRFIYAIDDHWVNSSHRQTLQQLYPDVHVEEKQRSHAFVLDPSTAIEYANMVGNFVVAFMG